MTFPLYDVTKWQKYGHARSSLQQDSAPGALYGLGTVPQPPSLPPPLAAGVHSSPVLSIHTQGAAGERAPPTPERNVHKFWNLKPWRGYLTFGSLEPVSTVKTPVHVLYSSVERAGFAGAGGNI